MKFNKQMKILVVDDDSSEAEFIAKLLMESKRDPENFCSIKTIQDIEAISSVDEYLKPDVIIVDIHKDTPNSVISKASKKFVEAAVVVMVSNVDDEAWLETESFKLGVQDLIDIKSISTGSLWKSVNYAITRKKMELTMSSDHENLDKANSILQITSEISRSIIDGQAHIEDMMTSMGAGLGIDGVAAFCGKCLNDGLPYCGWTGGKMKEDTYFSSDCLGKIPMSEDVASFIRYNLPMFTTISNLPISIKKMVSWAGFTNSSKVMVVPIMMDHEPWGMFCFYSLNGKVWSMAEMDALATLSRLGGAIIRNKQMEDDMVEEVQERFSEINLIINKGVH